jgi:hypothetical protein
MSDGAEEGYDDAVGDALGDTLGDALGLEEIVGEAVSLKKVSHLSLHVNGQKNLSRFPVPGCSFLHLLRGFNATYASHVLEELPSNPNETELSHGPRSTVGEDVGERVFLQSFLHVDGQKNLSRFPVPGWSFLHLLRGFNATYAAHVLEVLPSNPNETEFSHGPRSTVGEDVGERVFLQSLLHVDGQKNLSRFPVPGCSFLHLLVGFNATYASHVLEELPSNPNETEFSQALRS